MGVFLCKIFQWQQHQQKNIVSGQAQPCGYCVFVSCGLIERPWCGPWVWGLQRVLWLSRGRAALNWGLWPVYTLIFRFFYCSLPTPWCHISFHLGTHPYSILFWSSLCLPTPCLVKRILFPGCSQSLPIFICSFQSLLCSRSSFMCQDVTSQDVTASSVNEILLDSHKREI